MKVINRRKKGIKSYLMEKWNLSNAFKEIPQFDDNETITFLANHHLTFSSVILKMLSRIGKPSNIHLFTWTIGLKSFQTIVESNLVNEINVLTHPSLESRDPETFQYVSDNVKSLNLVRSHAKGCAIISEDGSQHCFIIGSANISRGTEIELFQIGFDKSFCEQIENFVLNGVD